MPAGDRRAPRLRAERHPVWGWLPDPPDFVRQLIVGCVDRERNVAVREAQAAERERNVAEREAQADARERLVAQREAQADERERLVAQREFRYAWYRWQ